MSKTTLQEFLIPKRTLAFQNKKGTITRQYQLNHYTIAFQNIIYLEFATKENPNGLENFVNRLTNNDPIACMKGIYLLIEDKTDFPVFADFTKMLDKYDAPLHELQILLMKVINESVPVYRKKKILRVLGLGMFLILSAGILYMM
jgi:hypothetical protein